MFEKIAIAILIVLVALLGYFGYLIYQARQDCAARGGQVVGTGEYTTVLMPVGKVLMPMQVEKTVCKIVEK